MRTLLVIALTCLFSAQASSTTAPGNSSSTKKVLYHGTLPNELARLANGRHEFKVRLYAQDSALLHEELLSAEVYSGKYDIVLGSSTPLLVDIKSGLTLAISVNGSKEIRCCTNLDQASVLNESLELHAIESQKSIGAIIPDEISASAVERYSIANGWLRNPEFRAIPMFDLKPSHLTGLRMDLALATQFDEPIYGYYQAAKYGRINVELNNSILVGNDNFGVAGQAMHVPHSLLLYAGGISTDVNGDGMFLMTLGAAHYQTGNARWEPFVNAPFMRFKYHSSDEDIFLYSELESTMHARSFLTATVGVGFRINQSVKVIGGFHHTEFKQPTEKQTRQVRGIHAIFSWGV